MITPEGSGSEHPRAPGRRSAVLVGVAGVMVLAGLIILGALTSPDPEAAAITTTTTLDDIEPPIDPDTFTVDQIATGPPLSWELVMAIDDHLPLALVDHEGAIYLFAGAEHIGGPDYGGLMAWRSRDGTDWEGLGQVIAADHRITAIASTAQGLVAAGIRLGDKAMLVWESADAVEWTGSVVPAPTDGAYFFHDPSELGASDDVLVLSSNVRYDRERLLEDRLRALGIDLDLSELVWNLRWLGAEGHHLIINGPLGVPVLRHPVDGLELSDQEREELVSELSDPLGTDIWVRDSNGNWENGVIGDARRVDSIVTTPTGGLIAYGTGTAGRLAKTSGDGLDWEPAVSTVSPWQPQSWKQRFVGAVNTPDLVVSADGETWRAAGLSDRFPDQLPWAPIAVGAGEGGVAMFVRGTRPLAPPVEDIAPRQLDTVDGSTLTYDFASNTFHVMTDGTGYEWTVDGEGTEVDPRRGIVEFHRRESGDVLASVTFAELQRVSREHAADRFDGAEPLSALAFSEDGEEWIIQDMTPEIGANATMWLLEVTSDRVVAAVRGTVGSQVSGAPGFEIWSAPIP